MTLAKQYADMIARGTPPTITDDSVATIFRDGSVYVYMNSRVYKDIQTYFANEHD
jgi:hypothetical protein